jgi:biopolymer transport protein ExbD
MALTLRRPQHETRVEIMPLIDVIFLLLTFFIYAMVLMVRAELLPIEMQSFVAGKPAAVTPAVTITIDRGGVLYLNRDEVSLEELLPRLEAHRAASPDTVVYVAAEATGDRDRLPTFLSLYDRLAFAGLDIRLVGSPGDLEAGDEGE